MALGMLRRIEVTFFMIPRAAGVRSIRNGFFHKMPSSFPFNFTLAITSTSPVGIFGGTTTFTVQFDPTGSSAGTKLATLSIANNDSDENPYNFNIRGIASAVPATEIDVLGTNDVTIPSGSAASIVSGTDFGSIGYWYGASVSRTLRPTRSKSG